MRAVTIGRAGPTLHILRSPAESLSCPYNDTHVPIRTNSWTFLLPIFASTDTVELRRLLADDAMAPVARLTDHMFRNLVVELLSSGRLAAVECRGQRAMPTVTTKAVDSDVHLGSRSNDFGICPRYGRHAAVPMNDVAVRQSVLDGFRRDQRKMKQLWQFMSTQFPRFTSNRSDDESLLRKVATMLAVGDIRMVQCLPTPSAGGRPRMISDADSHSVSHKQAAVDEAVKTWIGVELMNHQGKPVKYAKYRIQLPDGREMDRSLDANGQDYVENIDPGTCTISFFEYDAREWSEA